MAFPEIGQMAPSFTLNNQNGDPVSLEDYRGKQPVLVYFYPKASTPGCTTQACGLRDAKSELAERGIAVLGISPDKEPALRKFADKQGLNFELLSDPDHQVAEAYGAWGPKKFMGREYMGILRSSFIVDKEGRLKHVMDKVKTKTHDRDVLAWIDANL
mgnify:CR=1 FL=1